MDKVWTNPKNGQFSALSCGTRIHKNRTSRAATHHWPGDLVFVDINMPDLSVLQLVTGLSGPMPRVVSTTTYRDYAYEGYELEAADYLLKPIA